MNRLKKVHLSLLGAFVICLTFGYERMFLQVSAEEPSYNYSYWEEPVPAPPAYLPTMTVDGDRLGIEPFDTPNDIHVSADHNIYIADTGNNRIVILNDLYEYEGTIDSFINNGSIETLSSPQGVYVTEGNNIYIADTGNGRVVHLDGNHELIKVIEEPESEMLTQNFTFRPEKVVADNAGRVFVLSAGVFDGFMEFSADGHFTTFMGANRVQVDPIDYLWSRFATREQRSQMIMFIPTEFTNLDLDEDGFIYATNVDDADDVIKKVNARGDDILRREGYFDQVGDIEYDNDQGPSRFIDITVSENGIYSVLDSRRGRIFTYNDDGFLMYIFGGLGNKLGEFHTPIAIDRFDDQFLVLDQILGEITVFNATAYGATLDNAVRSYEQGDEEEAHRLYQEVVKMNVNLDFAYTGIGKALLRQDDFEPAMFNFEQSIDQANYSKAYLLYRNEAIRDNFGVLMGVIISISAVIIGFSVYRKKKRNRKMVL